MNSADYRPWAAVLLWVWVVAAFAFYLTQFRELILPVLSILGFE